MIRLLTAVVITIITVAFMTANTHNVMLSFVIGGPVKIRLIFLLMSTFLLGMLILGFTQMIWKLRAKRAPAKRSEPEDLVME